MARSALPRMVAIAAGLALAAAAHAQAPPDPGPSTEQAAVDHALERDRYERLTVPVGAYARGSYVWEWQVAGRREVTHLAFI